MKTSPSDDGVPGSRPATPGSAQPDAQRAALRPGEVGLANEARPGLGTRAVKRPDPARLPKSVTEPETRPEPREQDSTSLEQEEQRSTGVSGHMGAT